MKKFTVLVILALLAVAGTSYAADRVSAPMMEPTTVTAVPVIDRETLVAAGIDSTVDASVTALSTTAPGMLTNEISGKWGLVTIVTLAGVPYQLFLRPTTPCRIVDSRVDGGPFTNGEVRKYLLPGGVRCTTAIPQSITNLEGVVALVEVSLEADNYPWQWGDNGPVFDFVGTSYSPDWYGMTHDRGFLFASSEGVFPNTAVGKVRGFVALKRLPGPFVSLWGLEAQVKSLWSAKTDFRAHVTIDVVGYATPTFRQ